MPLNVASGNMYEWCSHTHAHLGGECNYRCSYCFVDNSRFGRPPRYTGTIRLLREELMVPYGNGRTIFVEHMNDIFGPGVDDDWVRDILAHCEKWPDNRYVFQSKNPNRFKDFFWPHGALLGTTIETNRSVAQFSNAPEPWLRYVAMKHLRWPHKFVTIEPVIDFDVDVMVQWISEINPTFVNLGADSKRRGLPEPSLEKIIALTARLDVLGVALRQKQNLDRLMKRPGGPDGKTHSRRKKTNQDE